MQQPHPHAWPLGMPPPNPRTGSVATVMSRPVITIDAGVSLDQALAKMEAYRVHHLLVTDRDRVVAVVSDRNLQRGLRIGLAARDDERHRRRPVFQVASYRLVTIEADASLAEAAAALLTYEVSALPVVSVSAAGGPEGLAIVGIITSRDLLRHLAFSHEAGASCLEHQADEGSLSAIGR